MSSVAASREAYDRTSSEPVEDTDTTDFVTQFSLEANYPVQVTDPHANAVTLHLTSMPSEYLSPSSNRIKQQMPMNYSYTANEPETHRLHRKQDQAHPLTNPVNF